MNITEKILELKKQYDIVGIVDLDYKLDNYELYYRHIESEFSALYQQVYSSNQRIIVTTTSSLYINNRDLKLETLYIILNRIDISNPFVTVLSTNPNVEQDLLLAHTVNSDPNLINFICVPGEFSELKEDKVTSQYRYGSVVPTKISLDSLTDRERFLLTESKVFCMYPWIHIHAYPTGEAYPCCHAAMTSTVGNTRKNTLNEIWHDQPMTDLRRSMLDEISIPGCKNCYEQEKWGFFSGRQSANKHHGHLIDRINHDNFRMSYWDIRFSNLCNLSCRSCGAIFSSSWYQDQVKLAGEEWKKNNKPLNFAGRYETDMWEQLEPHLDYVEQIYFAGGEPLLMEEHYNILEELVKRKKYNVRLIYNTNFTHTQLKGKSVFEYWKLFDSVAVGASLDDMEKRADYIRKGTAWDKVVENRRQMIKVCPQVDFYISPTLSIMNAMSLPDFHRSWVEQGLIKAQDLNVNILQNPQHYRLDIATSEFKDQLREKYLKHLEWLRPQDPLQRATVGFESAIKFMDSTDNSHLLPEFWARTHALDALRNEDILEVIPELIRLK